MMPSVLRAHLSLARSNCPQIPVMPVPAVPLLPLNNTFAADRPLALGGGDNPVHAIMSDVPNVQDVLNSERFTHLPRGAELMHITPRRHHVNVVRVREPSVTHLARTKQSR